MLGVDFVTNIVYCIWLSSNNIHGEYNKYPSFKFQLFIWLRFLPVQVRHKQDQQRLESLRNSKLILDNIIENIHAHAHVNI